MNSALVGFRPSPQQELLLEFGARAPVTQCAALLHGDLDSAGLRGALEAVIDRHEILRTTFVRPAGVRVAQQVVHEHNPPAWRSEPGDETLLREPGALDAVLVHEASQPFDLAVGPLLRVAVLELATERHLLILTLPAACADAESMAILLREACDDAAHEPLQYADYAEWRHALVRDEKGERPEGPPLWHGGAGGWPQSPNLLFGGRHTSPWGAPAHCRIELDAATRERVRAAAAGAHVSEAIFLEGCWHALVSRLSGEQELVLAGLDHGRRQADLEGALGPYAQAVPIPTSQEGGATLAEVIDQVARARSRAARLQDRASAEDLASFAASARIGFGYVDAVIEGRLGSARVEVVALTQRSAPMALQACFRSAGDELSGELWWDSAAYQEEDATEIASRFAILLAGAVRDGSRPVSQLPVVSDEERTRLAALAAGPPPPEPVTPVHHLFESRARELGSAPAVRAGDEEWTYERLNTAANHLAHHLRALGVESGRAVGLCMERSPEMVAGLLGILKAGAAYVPLNFEHPAPRLAHQLEESAATVLVSQQALLGHLPPFEGAVVCMDRDADEIDQRPPTNPEGTAGPDDLAYIMYTSGSTGLPKGAAITHRGLGTYTSGIVERLTGSDPGTDRLRFAVVSAISTDLGNTCIFPALASGGCLDLVSPEAAMDPDSLAAHAAAHPFDVLKITPSHLGALLAGGRAEDILPRRWLVVGGEAFPWELAERIHASGTGVRVLNHYGPTETTVGCCAYEVQPSPEPAGAGTVPIGTPLPGARIHVLDRELAPLPPGVPGELCVAGPGVARGYVARPQETAERFVADPLTTEPDGRLYRTGDRVRRLRDGALEFLGRLDDQLKIRGNRVELGEIEAVLARHPDVRQAAVAAREDDHGDPRLVGYVVGAPGLLAESLEAFAAASLPEYMVPSAYVLLPALPFTPSGKVDRQALPEPAALSRAVDYVAPRDSLEEEVAAIWTELLGVDRVGVHDDFFALGGHSLLATQAIMRIRRSHGDVPLRALLDAPTVAGMAEALRGP